MKMHLLNFKIKVKFAMEKENRMDETSRRVLRGKYVIGTNSVPIKYEMGCGEESEYVEDAKLYATFEDANSELKKYVNPKLFKIYSVCDIIKNID